MVSERDARRGSLQIGVAQLIIVVGQFAYSSATARLFTPHEFGEFTAALSLQGILLLASMTGLPSYILREPTLDRRVVTRLRIYALVGAVASGTLYLAISGLWLTMLAASGGMQFVPLLSAALLIAPFSGIESALLRREGRQRDDALILVVSFLLSSAGAIAVALLTKSAWALAVAVVGNSLLTLVLSTIWRRVYYRGYVSDLSPTRIGYVGQVTLQNLIFLILNQAPGWVLSATQGPTQLGQYTRATVLTQFPATTMANALNRALQPMWRHLEKPKRFASGLMDAVRLSAFLSGAVFAIVFAVGVPLTRIWLGEGWGVAGQLIAPLAAFGATYVPYGVLAASLEMRAKLREIRLSQAVFVVILCIGIAVYLTRRDVVVLAVAVAASQFGALLALSVLSATTVMLSPGRSVRHIVGPLAWASLIAVIARFAVSAVETSAPDFVNDLFGVAVGSAVVLLGLIATLRWQSTTAVAVRRGFRIPRVFIRTTGTEL